MTYFVCAKIDKIASDKYSHFYEKIYICNSFLAMPNRQICYYFDYQTIRFTKNFRKQILTNIF